MSMRTSLVGLATFAAKEIGRCQRQAGLEELAKNVVSVIEGREPMSEFARFYCFVPDEPVTDVLLERLGFDNHSSGSLALKQDFKALYSPNKAYGWVFEDDEGDVVNIPTPKNYAELWILCQALGFKLPETGEDTKC